MISARTHFYHPSQLCPQYGVKILMYGTSGSGKTPCLATAPNAVICATEPGLLSLRSCNLPVYPAFTVQAIEDFFLWLNGSAEAKNFDTVCVDSMSEMSEIYLTQKEIEHKHGLQAYGEMAKAVMKHALNLYFMPQKHIVLTAKQAQIEAVGINKKVPYFPGNELNAKIPYKYDELLHIGIHRTPQGDVRCIRTKETIEYTARDRSGMLNELETSDLTSIITKCMT